MNLIYDRTAEDVERALALAKKAEAGTLTDAEKTEWLAGMKGCYNATDLNRVEAAVKQLASALTSAGYPAAVTPVLKGSSRLPNGYTELEYIESTGTQYIDTGIKPNQDTSIEIEAIPSAVGETYLGEGFCPYAAGVSNNDSAFECYTSHDQYEFDYDGQIAYLATATVGDVLKINHSKNVVSLTVNGADAYTQIFEYKSFESPYTLTLFARHRASLVYSKGKIKKCKIKSGDTLVRDFYPAKSINGTIGLYDLVNSAFYTNAGTGVFTAGAEIGALEDREWRESDIVRLSQWRQYLANVQALRDAYYTLSETGQLPDAADRLDYTGANNIEKILADIDLLIGWMKSSYRRCGTFQAGNNAAHLPLKGSV